MSSPLDPLLEPLAGFIGTWRGAGRGVYPTITDFDYDEELVLEVFGKPLLSHRLRTTVGDRTSHSEAGFWRPTSGGIELQLAHTTGHVEQAMGSVTGGRVEFASTSIVGAPTSKDVTEITRLYALNDDVLDVEVRMAAVGVPLAVHLRSRLRRA